MVSRRQSRNRQDYDEDEEVTIDSRSETQLFFAFNVFVLRRLAHFCFFFSPNVVFLRLFREASIRRWWSWWNSFERRCKTKRWTREKKEELEHQPGVRSGPHVGSGASHQRRGTVHARFVRKQGPHLQTPSDVTTMINEDPFWFEGNKEKRTKVYATPAMRIGREEVQETDWQSIPLIDAHKGGKLGISRMAQVTSDGTITFCSEAEDEEMIRDIKERQKLPKPHYSIGYKCELNDDNFTESDEEKDHRGLFGETSSLGKDQRVHLRR